MEIVREDVDYGNFSLSSTANTISWYAYMDFVKSLLFAYAI